MSNFLKFQIDLENFITNLKNIITTNNQEIEKLLNQKVKTYKNFVKPLEDLELKLEKFFTPLSHLNSVKNSDEIQKIYIQALPLITTYSTKLSQNIDLYNTYKYILEHEKINLNNEEIRVLELNIQNFELSGANLDKKTKKRLEEINIEKSKLSNQFSQNLIDATNSFSYIIEDFNDVKNLPKSDLENAKFKENGNIKYKFTLQIPSYLSYMQYGTNRKIREELYKAYVSRAPENEEIIEKILKLRDEMSKLLGFKNYVSYSLVSKMAKNESDVINFLENLLKNSISQAQNELKELEKIAPFKLESYDIAFFSEKLRKELYDIDQELYRPYFEKNNVLNGLFIFLNKLFGLEFKKVDEKLWDKKAISYDLYENKKLKARIYFDLETRDSKQTGAWMNNWQTHYTNQNGKEELASAFIVCNFPKSTNKNKSLLRHDDVVTLFHEMGHAIHHVLSEVNESEISGVNGIEWDAVEFPSQFLENFAYEPEVLKLFAKHIDTNEILNDKMIKKLVDGKNFLSALNMIRQLEFSLFDLKIHTQAYSKNDVQNILNNIREQTSLIKTPKYNKFQNSFAHIFAGGYAAGYYSYKWAEVLSADSFYKVVDEGIFNSNISNKYLNIILHKGASNSMKILYKEFMERDVDTTKLLRLNGIKI